MLNIFLFKMPIFSLFTPNARVIRQSRQLMGPPFGSSAAQTTGTAIPLKEIVKFARFQHVGECCGDVHCPTSPLASPAPPVCEPYTPLPAGGARKFEAHTQLTCRLEFASHQSGRAPDAKLAARTTPRQQKTLAHPHPEHAPGHQCRFDPAINSNM
jgi:hypothetical protein